MTKHLPSHAALTKALEIKVQWFSRLAYRWHDEKDYEGFDEYVQAVKKEFPSCTRGTKRPFAFYFDCNEGEVKVKVGGSQVTIDFTPKVKGVELTAPAAKEVTKTAKSKGANVPEPMERVGSFIRRMISKGLENAAILELVHVHFPAANTTAKCVSWYRHDMKAALELQAVSQALEAKRAKKK